MKILQISDIHWHNIHALTDVYRDIREGLIQDITLETIVMKRLRFLIIYSYVAI